MSTLQLQIEKEEEIGVGTSRLTSLLRSVFDAAASTIVFYAPPGSGKTYLMRQMVHHGLLVIDTDDIYFYWYEKFKGKFSDTEARILSEEMTGWSFFSAITPGNIRFIVTNLHNSFLSYAARQGALIVGYLPEEETFKKQVLKRTLEKCESYKLIKSWYKDVQSWKETNYSKIDVWIKDTSEVAFTMYQKVHSYGSVSNVLLTGLTYQEERSKFGHAMRTTAVHLVNKENMTYVAVGASVVEIEVLAYFAQRSKLIGQWYLEDISTPLTTQEDFQASGEYFGEDKRPILHNALAFVGDAIEVCYVMSDMDFLNPGELPLSTPIIKITDVKQIKTGRLFSFFLYYSNNYYELPEISSSTTAFGEKWIEHYDICAYVSRMQGCVRSIYCAVSRPIFDKLGIKNCTFKFFPMPYMNYSSTRCYLINGLSFKVKAHLLSFTELYRKVVSHNLSRKYSVDHDENIYRHILGSLIHQMDGLDYKPIKGDFIVALFSVTNDKNSRSKTLLTIKSWCQKGRCLVTIPNRQAQHFLYQRKHDKVEHMKMSSYLASWDKTLSDHAFYPSEFWHSPHVRIYPILDVFWRARYNNFRGRWHMKHKFAMFNGSTNQTYLYYFVGNLEDMSEHYLQTHTNSQTHVMKAVAKFYRMTFGISSDAVYTFRSQVAKERDPKLTVFDSSKGTYTDGVSLFNTPGHIINMIIAGVFYPVDFHRFIRTFEGNWKLTAKKDKKLLEKYKKAKINRDLAEADSSALELWHHPGDLVDVVGVIKVFQERLGLPNILPLSWLSRHLQKLTQKYQSWFKPQPLSKALKA